MRKIISAMLLIAPLCAIADDFKTSVNKPCPVPVGTKIDIAYLNGEYCYGAEAMKVNHCDATRWRGWLSGKTIIAWRPAK